ncbi:MAG: DUF134 domain-containing protein [Candidatus Pacearchaeota archaeon]|nr:DUF134 domain-containing protein [Candidatus Pacearchaeota archaeon]
MARPKLTRKISTKLKTRIFVPVDVIMPEDAFLEADELEALKLKDMLALDQKEAAKAMAISQPTFHRIIKNARKKIAEALVKGKVIKIKESMK